MPLIAARIKDEAFIQETVHCKTDTSHFNLWWLGQSGYLLQWNNRQLLLDPYLSDSLTTKYAATNKPHIRMSERVVNPALLKNIDILTSSHNHTDHLDAATIIPVLQNNPGIQFIIPEANRSFVTERAKIALEYPIGLNDKSSVTIDEISFYGIPAAHNTIERDEKGKCKCMGYIISFGQWNIYHSGDTLLFDGMETLLKPFKVDIAILPINGNDPARGVAGNLNAAEAAALGKAIGARLVIPCHYDMFSFNTADVQDFAKEATAIQQPFYIMENGGHFSSEQLY
jgi:L-ascorbate metabolism protein UlaG (beta-lactamase superfamily)